MMLSPRSVRREMTAGSGRKRGKAASTCQSEAGPALTMTAEAGAWTRAAKGYSDPLTNCKGSQKQSRKPAAQK